MQSVITHPLGIEAGIESAKAQSEMDIGPQQVEQVIERSKARSSIERLEVYGNAYFARLMECMGEFFPATVHALGRELFDQFAWEYLNRYPSQSYTLGRLADRFLIFLEETRDEFEERSQQTDEDGVSWSDFYIDLARLEWTIEQVFDGPGVEKESLLSTEELAKVGAERWPAARLQPVVCLRLLQLKYPVNDYYTAFRSHQSPEIPAPSPTFLALTRRQYVVRRFSLSQPQFTLLDSLVRGEQVGAAIESAAETVEDWDDFAAQLQVWFRWWSSEGFFHRIAVD